MKSTKRPTGNMPYLFDDFFTKDFFGINPGSFTQRAASPAVNIKETDGDFQLEVSAPGMKKDDFVLEFGILYFCIIVTCISINLRVVFL